MSPNCYLVLCVLLIDNNTFNCYKIRCIILQNSANLNLDTKINYFDILISYNNFHDKDKIFRLLQKYYEKL